MRRLGHRFDTDPERYPAVRGLLRTEELPGSDNYYHEVLTPFQLTLMSIRSAHPERSTLSIYAPGASVHLPPLPPDVSELLPNMHRHNCYEFTYIVEGSMYQLVNGKRFYYPAGSCCLMNRNTLHAEEDSTDYTCIFLSLTEDFVDRLTGFGGGFLFPGEQEAPGNSIFRFFGAGDGNAGQIHRDFLDFVPRISQTEQEVLVHSLFEQMLRTLIDPVGGATYRLLELLTRLITILGDENRYNVSHVTAETSLEKLLLSRIDRILSQRRGRITNRELAEVLHYNGSYLGRIVKKHTRKSLFDYSMDFTMASAAELLRKTEKPAAVIAAELQFTNLSHFYQLFRERYGQTPGAYRRTAGAHKTGTP